MQKAQCQDKNCKLAESALRVYTFSRSKSNQHSSDIHRGENGETDCIERQFRQRKNHDGEELAEKVWQKHHGHLARRNKKRNADGNGRA